MDVLLGIVISALILATGFGCYMWADAKASRRLVEWNERTNPSTAVIDAIRQTQAQSQEMVATLTSTITTSMKTMLGLDRSVESYDPLAVYEDETEPTPRPFAETDPWMNDDFADDADVMRPVM